MRNQSLFAKMTALALALTVMVLTNVTRVEATPDAESYAAAGRGGNRRRIRRLGGV